MIGPVKSVCIGPDSDEARTFLDPVEWCAPSDANDSLSSATSESFPQAFGRQRAGMRILIIGLRWVDFILIYQVPPPTSIGYGGGKRIRNVTVIAGSGHDAARE